MLSGADDWSFENLDSHYPGQGSCGPSIEELHAQAHNRLLSIQPKLPRHAGGHLQAVSVDLSATAPTANAEAQ